MSNQPTTEKQLEDAYNEIIRLQHQLADAQQALLRVQTQFTRHMRREIELKLTTARTWPEALQHYRALMRQRNDNPINCRSAWFEDQANLAETAAETLSRYLDNEELQHAEAQVADLRAKAIAETANHLEVTEEHNNIISQAMRLIPEDEDRLGAWLKKLTPR